MSRSLAVILIAIAIGCVLGYVDSRPGWDDTGVTAGAVLISAAALALARPRAAAPVGVLVGLPVVLFDTILHGGYGSLLAFAFSMAGAALGYGVGRVHGRQQAS
jgi:hypothetical protein